MPDPASAVPVQAVPGPAPAPIAVAAVPVAAAPPAAHPGPLTRLMHAVLPHAEAGVHDVEAVVAKLRADYRAHAKSVFEVEHLALAAAEVVDPADAPVIAELEQKAIALAGDAARIAAAVLAA